MNRAERRAAAALAKKLPAKKHRPPRQPGKPIRPWPHEVRHVFAPIEQVFDELRQGEITEIDGQPAFRDGEGNWFTVAPAIAGWVDAWQRLNQRLGLGIDLAPLQALGEALEAGAVKRSMAAAVECTDRVAELERKLEEARLALDVRQGQVKRLEAEADALRGLCDGQAVYKVPDEGIPSAAPAWGKCAVNGAPNGRHCPASFAFDIRRCTGSAPCKHRREGE